MDALFSLFSDSAHHIGGKNMKRELIEKFHQRLVELAKQSIATGNDEAIRLGNGALRTLTTKAGLQVAFELLSKPPASYTGFTIMKALDLKHLTVESAVLEERFNPLFNDAQRQVAKQRMDSPLGRER
jgi:hypothetical protein